MSAFDDVALPGRMPESGSGAGTISPDALFKNNSEKLGKLVDIPKSTVDFRVRKVKVEIFDLSDISQRKKYERLWASLLVKVSKMEAVVESSKDLVKRPDGTSYWMRYVEYVEFEEPMKPSLDMGGM